MEEPIDAQLPPIEPKRIALVAHDRQKAHLIDWCLYNQGTLSQHELIATGTTGRLLEDALELPFTKLKSGPLGGDQQIGAMIAEGKIDMLIFFWDPLESMSHDVDIKALLRLATVWNIPMACNRATADYMFASPLIGDRYERWLPDYDDYIGREVEGTTRKQSPDAEEAM